MATQKQLAAAAEEASQRSKHYDFRVNRRNGYYALDYYSKEDHSYIGYIECFNAHDMMIYLRGFINGSIYIKY